MKIKILILAILIPICLFSQDNKDVNLQSYTPSKLLDKGKWDIKWFNNLYTQTQREDKGTKLDEPRSNYFTSSVEAFTGITESKKFNIGLIVEFRSNSFAGQDATSVFSFKNEIGKSRSGLAHIAPSIKISPFSSVPRFTIQSSFFIPVFDKESNQNGYLANKSFIWQNRFFYEYAFSDSKFQLFSELGTRYFFGQKTKNSDGSFNENGGYANSSLELAPGIFLSYFPTNKITTLAFLQHSQLIEIDNKFSQNYTSLGLGVKYQLSNTLNLETLYSKFIRGNDSGLGQSFNFGLRAIF